MSICERMVRRALCTAQELIASFPTAADAFFWFGGASYAEVLDHEAEIDKTRPAVHADWAPPCNGQGPPSYMVFDVETDGGSPKQLAIQLAFIVFDEEHRELYRFDKLLRLPAGKRINYYSMKIHRITDNILRLRGVDPYPELLTFFDWVDKVHARCGRVIAHNAAFDTGVITNTAAQNGVDRELEAHTCFCTMRSALPYCNLVDKRGKPKVPKNSELYSILHDGANPEDTFRLHDALSDVRVSAASYQAGLRRQWW